MNRYFGLHTLEGEWHALLPRYLCLAQRVDGKTVLDIGCGNGLGASLLLELGAARVHAIDHRPAVLELARMKHTKEHLDFHIMLWEELDFEAQQFDMILCLDPSSPVTDPNLLREVRRVLKPNGEYVCAIERQNVHGMEALLPRYGYANSAQRVDVHQAIQRVPQLGELSNHFEQIVPVAQRPQLSYVFEPAEFSGRPAVDLSLSDDAMDAANVELWFCGNATLSAPSARDVRMPYHAIMERLSATYTTQSAHDFDEIVQAEGGLRETTGVFDSFSKDEDPTGVRQRPSLQELERAAQDSQHSAQLLELSALSARIKSDFERLYVDARASFEVGQRALSGAIDRVGQLGNAAQPQGTLGHSAAFGARVEELETVIARLSAERDELRRELTQAQASLEDQMRDTSERDAATDPPVDELAQDTTDDAPEEEAAQSEES